MIVYRVRQPQQPPTTTSFNSRHQPLALGAERSFSTTKTCFPWFLITVTPFTPPQINNIGPNDICRRLFQYCYDNETAPRQHIPTYTTCKRTTSGRTTSVRVVVSSLGSKYCCNNDKTAHLLQPTPVNKRHLSSFGPHWQILTLLLEQDGAKTAAPPVLSL